MFVLHEKQVYHLEDSGRYMLQSGVGLKCCIWWVDNARIMIALKIQVLMLSKLTSMVTASLLPARKMSRTLIRHPKSPDLDGQM